MHADVRPPSCVLDAFTDAAIAACDDLDGVKDDIIAYPGLCDFQASSLVGKIVNCTDPSGSITITDKMAELVGAMWAGPKFQNGEFLWYGYHYDSDLTGVLTTTCNTTDDCTVTAFSASSDWYQTFLAKNSSWSAITHNVTADEFDRLSRISIDEYTSSIGTDNPDLTNLKARGTKLLTWHGMQDPLIPTNGTIDYYERVMAKDPNVTDYYRFFLAPGVSHCGGGAGFDPSDYLFAALRNWVENGTAPETISGTGTAVGNSSATRTVNLCLYPKVLTYTGTDPDDASSFSCL